MCRATVTPDARQPLAHLIRDMAAVLAQQHGASTDDVHIGPVDFGPAEAGSPQ